MKTLITSIIFVACLFISGCMNLATGQSSIITTVTPVTASSYTQTTSSVNDAPAVEEYNGEDVDFGPQIEPLPLDF